MQNKQDEDPPQVSENKNIEASQEYLTVEKHRGRNDCVVEEIRQTGMHLPTLIFNLAILIGFTYQVEDKKKQRLEGLNSTENPSELSFIATSIGKMRAFLKGNGYHTWSFIDEDFNEADLQCFGQKLCKTLKDLVVNIPGIEIRVFCFFTGHGAVCKQTGAQLLYQNEGYYLRVQDFMTKIITSSKGVKGSSYQFSALFDCCRTILKYERKSENKNVESILQKINNRYTGAQDCLLKCINFEFIYACLRNQVVEAKSERIDNLINNYNDKLPFSTNAIKCNFLTEITSYYEQEPLFLFKPQFRFYEANRSYFEFFRQLFRRLLNLFNLDSKKFKKIGKLIQEGFSEIKELYKNSDKQHQNKNSFLNFNPQEKEQKVEMNVDEIEENKQGEDDCREEREKKRKQEIKDQDHGQKAKTKRGNGRTYCGKSLDGECYCISQKCSEEGCNCSKCFEYDIKKRGKESLLYKNYQGDYIFHNQGLFYCGQKFQQGKTKTVAICNGKITCKPCKCYAKRHDQVKKLEKKAV